MQGKNLQEENFDELIIRYLDGYATEAEKHKLKAWMKRSAANRESFEEMKRIWQNAGDTGVLHGLDVDADWKQVAERISPAPRVIRSTSFRKWRAVAAALLLLITAAVGYQQFRLSADPFTTIDLADGSQVWLAPGSQLEYPDEFSANTREVKLHGKAFFEITKDPQKPFIIAAGQTEIEVLGTSFNVVTGPESTEVIVATGEVQVTAIRSPDKKLHLTAEEKGIYQDNNLHEEINSNPNYLAWKTNVLEFDGVSITKVLEEVGAHYDRRLELVDPTNNTCEFTATFSNQKLRTVLTVIERSCDVKVRQFKE